MIHYHNIFADSTWKWLSRISGMDWISIIVLDWKFFSNA